MLFLLESDQNFAQFLKRVVFWVLIPTFDVDSILRLQQEISGVVVDDESLGQVSSQLAKVFEEDSVLLSGGTPVESVRNQLSGIESVQNPVRIVLHCGGKDHYFVVLAHELDELLRKGS